MKSSTKKLKKLFKIIPEEFESLFQQKLTFCISNIEKYFKKTENEFIVLSSSTFKDTLQESNKNQAIIPIVRTILALSKWDGIDLLPHRFLDFFKDLSHRYSPNERIRALYMIAKTGTKKKEVEHLDELVEIFRNNFSVLNILERKLISWTGNNDFCSSYIACAHFMKNILASSTVRGGTIGIKAKKMQHFYEVLETVAKEIQQRTKLKLLDKYDGNITKDLMKQQAIEMLDEYDGIHHSLFSLFSPFIHELMRIITMRSFFKKLLLAKKQKTLQNLITEYYSRMNRINSNFH
ncbi:predicted protein [Naegleria gruberi]|uniref:Predicted protein n=1 Tax=Naegleria gruberi TaxID=5762 RepID=D2VL25_NAEGR|nr:uncharacterized protein NAEGRDRAFT_69637 [Naegleria gruberi]EFC42463.1 predicted protein [Naegleria gruberi]|eukprot:XP_002675207.1 predicted protein [Naegleria gruberi strain NEG-M]